MTPAFALNLLTANMFTRSLYSPRNILSKPTWIQGKDLFRETGTEIVEEGGIENKEMLINVSNVAFLDPKMDVPTKIGYKVENGKKVRFAKKSGVVID
jgi:hypothetical protein